LSFQHLLALTGLFFLSEISYDTVRQQ
jgi:hypothetical protein